MDFFEKAHVVKKESSRKEHKSDVAVKKQLKQMLTGYKKHDSRLIRTCDDAFDPSKLLDESSSVSGYSDLNLTNSSTENDTTRGQMGSDSEDYVNLVDDDLSHSDSPSFSKDNSSGSIDLSKDSISELDDNIQTLSDNITSQVTIDSSSEASDDISLDNSSDVSITESPESEFDPDGTLAGKILEKLQSKGVVNKKGTKRKLDNKLDNPSSKFDKQKFKEALPTKNVKQKLTKEPSPTKDFEESSTSSQSTNLTTSTVDKENDTAKEIDIGTNDTTSSDFVSIAVSDSPLPNLSDIIGDYQYPTVRNIPDGQNLHSTDNSGSFTVENLNLEDVQFLDDDAGNKDPRADDTIEDDITYASDVDASSGPASESAEIYDETLNSENTSDKEMSVESVDTNFKRLIKVYYGDTTCVFFMKNLSELYIHGKVIVTVLQGAIDICGHRLGLEPCEVYAPNYNYAFSLKALAEDPNVQGTLFTKLKSAGLSDADAEEIHLEIEQYDCVVSLKRLDNHKMDFVENNITPTDLFSKINKNTENCFRKAAEKLRCSLYLTRPYKVFEELSCWRQFVKLGFGNPSRGIVCGGKGVGKSTSLRYCVNRLLARGPVLVVDLDPGQAEFTVAGNISATVVTRPLLGPNFTHLQTPKMVLNLGMINTMDNPRRYAAAVTALISHCNTDEQLKSMPWLVNTMGLCNAMGLKFITQIILQTKPTYLLQINAKNPKKNFETLLNPENVRKIYEQYFLYDSLFRNVRCPEDLNYSFLEENRTDNVQKSNTSLAPRDERYLNFLAYFSDLLSSRKITSLLGITPYEVKLGDMHIGLNIKISNDAVAKVINGKIIALCQLTTLDKNGKVFTLKDKPLLCHGHGLIRGIDLQKEILYVLTPAPVTKLSLVDTLVYADWVPELRRQEKHLPDGVTVPYRAPSMHQQRQLMFTPKRRFNPLQLLKMSRNT